jgi:3-hydroxybenzoate 6-monooxygenase
MLNEGEPRMIGYVAHRTIVPMDSVTFDVDRDNVVLWSGHGFHIVHYPLRNRTLFNIVTVFRTSATSRRAIPQARIPTLPASTGTRIPR